MFYEHDDVEHIAGRYAVSVEELGFTADQLIMDADDSEFYEGSYGTIFIKDGKLYENHCFHCSCYGCEGQWDPEETTLAALRMRPHFHGEPIAQIFQRAVSLGYLGS